jgi:pimeloyl-ACP methyl ester carboxylesterase
MILLLHSSGLSARQWGRLVSELGSRPLLAPDLIGHGASPPWPEPKPFSFRMDVDALVTKLDAEGPMHVVGHSYGALVGLLAALARPRLVPSLVLFEPVAFGLLDPVRDRDACDELARASLPWEVGPERWLQSFVDYWGGQGAWAALREEARAEFRRVGWVVREAVKTLLEDRTPASAYRVLDQPVCLLTGEKSPLAARRVVERLAAELPNASVVRIPGAGHMAPLTHPDPVNRAIIERLGS